MVIMQYIVAIVGSTAGRPLSGDDPNGVRDPAAVRAMIAFICLNIFCFATTWGPTGWVVIGEGFPLPIRSRGVGISTACNWFWNCIIAVVAPYMVGNANGSANLGPKIFFIWGSLSIFSGLFAYFLVPEMKGLTLEQIDKMMEEVSPRKSRKWMPKAAFVAELARRDVEKSRQQWRDVNAATTTAGLEGGYHQEANEMGAMPDPYGTAQQGVGRGSPAGGVGYGINSSMGRDPYESPNTVRY